MAIKMRQICGSIYGIFDDLCGENWQLKGAWKVWRFGSCESWIGHAPHTSQLMRGRDLDFFELSLGKLWITRTVIN
jgi:hypothetical protein